MSNPYDNPPGQQPGQDPYSQGDPYGQGNNPYSQGGPYQAGAAPYGQPVPYGQPYGGIPAEHPQGTLILVFGIIGIFSGIFAPIAWYLGNKARKEIAATGAQYSNEQNINIGRTLGKVFTIIYIAVIVLTIVFSIIILIAGLSQSPG
jgi:hypothetical protein